MEEAVKNPILTGAVATPEFWLAHLPRPDQVLLDAAAIADVNDRILKCRYSNMYRLDKQPQHFSQKRLLQLLKKSREGWELDKLPDAYWKGEKITAAVWKELFNNCQLDGVPNDPLICYGVTIQRTNLRLLPTTEGMYDGASDIDKLYDYLQGTALDPAEAFLILHESRDKKFFFGLARNYAGWVAVDSVALAAYEPWREFATPKRFATVLAAKVTIGPAKQLYQMGARIPLDGEGMLCLPAVERGRLRLDKLVLQAAAGVSRSGSSGKSCGDEFRDEAHSDGETPNVKNAPAIIEGVLSFTRANIIKQAFKQLGQEYDFGGKADSVDCSSFVAGVYRTLGIELPRNADSQEHAMPIRQRLTRMDPAEKLAKLQQTAPGALLFRRGHVMMYLGSASDGTPIIIHAMSSCYDKKQKVYVRRVAVSPVTYKHRAARTCLEALSNMGEIIP